MAQPGKYRTPGLTGRIATGLARQRFEKLTDDGAPILITTHYSKAELSGYLQSIVLKLDENIDEHNFTAPSGFYWLPMNKFELYLYNLRHIQHHTGQLVERLHDVGVKEVAWY